MRVPDSSVQVCCRTSNSVWRQAAKVEIAVAAVGVSRLGYIPILS